MTNQNNPYGGGGGYAGQSVQFGSRGHGASQDVIEPAVPAAGMEPGGLIKDTSTAAFKQDVIQESNRQPVLVDFWAPWCGPCKQLTPVLEKMVREAAGQVKLVKMNIDEHPSIPGQLGIQSIPAVIAFVDGKPVDGFMGAIPESQIREFLQRIGKSAGAAPDIAADLEAAAKARAAGDAQLAAQIYSDILADLPDSIEAVAGLAELLFEAGDRAGAEELLAGVSEKHADAPALAAIRGKMALADQAAGLGSAAEFERRLKSDPQDHQARFDLAMVQNSEGKRTEAADNLLDIVRTDRTWNEDGARAQLLKFFEAWGMTDEATLAARRKLSSLLFS